MKRLVGGIVSSEGKANRGQQVVGEGKRCWGWRGQEEQSAHRGHPGQGQTGEGKGEVHRG